MDALTPASTIHYYDTRLRRILCGLRGFDHRSTKHSRDVTCDACVGLLRERAATAAGERPLAASDASMPT